MGSSYPVGALLRLARAIQASNFDDFESVCKLLMVGVVEIGYYACGDVQAIWKDLLA